MEPLHINLSQCRRDHQHDPKHVNASAKANRGDLRPLRAITMNSIKVRHRRGMLIEPFSQGSAMMVSPGRGNQWVHLDEIEAPNIAATVAGAKIIPFEY